MDIRPFTASFAPDTGVLSISGEVDELSGPELRTAIQTHSAGLTRDLTVDLSDVDFLPSSGVGVLAVAQTTAGRSGTKLELVAASGTIAQRVLQICGLPYREL